MSFYNFEFETQSNDADEEERLCSQFCEDLRRLQQRSQCTDAVIGDVVLTLGKYLNLPDPPNFKSYDKKLQKDAGATFLKLNGCVDCNKFVFLPDDARRHCPLCGGARYDENGHAREVFSYLISCI